MCVCLSICALYGWRSATYIPFDGFPISGSRGLLSLSFSSLFSFTTTYFFWHFVDIFPFFFPSFFSCLFALFLVVLLAASYLILSLPFWFVCRYFCLPSSSNMMFFECYVTGFCIFFFFFSQDFLLFFHRTCRWVPWLTSSVSFSDGWLRLRDTRSIPPSLVQQSVSSSACPARQDTWMVTRCV
jgi:hypothetical protein